MLRIYEKNCTVLAIRRAIQGVIASDIRFWIYSEDRLVKDKTIANNSINQNGRYTELWESSCNILITYINTTELEFIQTERWKIYISVVFHILKYLQQYSIVE